MLSQQLIASILVIVCSALTYAIVLVYRHRARVARWRKEGLTLAPGWTWAFGHLGAMAKASSKVPADLNVALIIPSVFEDSEDQYRNFMFDIWPLSSQVIVCTTPEAAAQGFGSFEFPRSPMVRKGMAKLTGGPDMLSMDGPEWKFWRSIFNPGFSTASMNAQIGVVVDRVEEFARLLEEHAGQDLTSLSDLTSRLTADVIVKLALDLDINYQRSNHPLIHAYNKILQWTSFWDPRVLLNPLTAFVQSYYGNIMDKIIQDRLEELFHEMKSTKHDISTSPATRRSVAELALRAYMDERKLSDDGGRSAAALDPIFRKYATYQIRLFLLAGNDTTATTIVYIYHLLHEHPEALSLMREEHNRVLGSGDKEQAAAQIRDNPALLNGLLYTMAVIKETLRLFPAGAASRHGPPDASIVAEDGEVIPVEDSTITSNHFALHRNPRFWPRPDEFLPERWLVAPSDELYPRDAAAFRPFEQGPRNCIGQTLVMNEIRCVLALTAREYRISPAYEEFDKRKRSEAGIWKKLVSISGFGNEIKTFRGNRAYPTDQPGARPADGYPCWINKA